MIKQNELVCIACGSTFLLKAPNKVYCTPSCRRNSLKEIRSKYNKDKYRKKIKDYKPPVGKCAICNKDFLIVGPRRVTCSKECGIVRGNTIRKELGKSEKYIQKAKDYRKTAKYKNKKRNYTEEQKQARKVYCLNNKHIFQNIRERNKAAINARKRKAHRNKFNNDLEYRLQFNFRSRFKGILKNKKVGRHLIEFIDYTYKELKEYLESLWLEGMTWDNYGNFGWHIDHIKPIALFKHVNKDGSLNEAEIRECWKLENLQPLWAQDNLSKGSKYLNKEEKL